MDLFFAPSSAQKSSKNPRILQEMRESRENFSEFLEIFNVFDEFSRQPLSEMDLKLQSLSDLMRKSSLTYEEFNTKLFKALFPQLSVHDRNNLCLIRALVRRDFAILMRMFNEVPIFLARKLSLHPNSQRFYTIKMLLLVISFSDTNLTYSAKIIEYLLRQIDFHTEEDEDIKKKQFSAEIVRNTTGLDFELFSLICALDSGDFSKILSYLAFKNEDFLVLPALFAWIYAPFLVHLYIYDENEENRCDLSRLLMFGVFYVLQMFCESIGTNFFENAVFVELRKYLKTNILAIFQMICKEISERPIYNIDWHDFSSLYFEDFFETLNYDFHEFIKENFEGEEQKIYEDFKKLFGIKLSSLMNFLRNKYENLFKSEKNEYLKALLDFFLSYYNVCSGRDAALAEISLENQLNDTFSLENQLKTFLQLHFCGKTRKKSEEDASPSSKTKEIQRYFGVIQLSLVGFHTIERKKNFSSPKADVFLSQILEQ